CLDWLKTTTNLITIPHLDDNAKLRMIRMIPFPDKIQDSMRKMYIQELSKLAKICFSNKQFECEAQLQTKMRGKAISSNELIDELLSQKFDDIEIASKFAQKFVLGSQIPSWFFPLVVDCFKKGRQDLAILHLKNASDHYKETDTFVIAAWKWIATQASSSSSEELIFLATNVSLPHFDCDYLVNTNLYPTIQACIHSAHTSVALVLANRVYQIFKANTQRQIDLSLYVPFPDETKEVVEENYSKLKQIYQKQFLGSVIDFCLDNGALSSAIRMERGLYQFEERQQTPGETTELFGLNHKERFEARLTMLEKLSLEEKQDYIFLIYADLFRTTGADSNLLSQRHDRFLKELYTKFGLTWFLVSVRTCSEVGLDPQYVEKLIDFLKTQQIYQVYYESLEEEINLQKAYPRFCQALGILLPRTLPSAEQIRLALTKHAERVKQVKSLDLSDLGLEKIPNEILLFIQLDRINVSKNRLKVFPKIFNDSERGSNLTALTSVDLSHNQIEEVPARLQRLDSVYLEGNPLSKSRSLFNK
ncbi:MAG: leucine-rich repeat domain-containing protein, partial [Candidatus Melainabacteria bacterium]|nr:leucine-rich repeat domain-containing protein [Candidatus Melainabacteria bacterium]